MRWALRRRPRPAPPAPFVVGMVRSGTTLLRLQLDAHPELAIPPETGWGIALRDAGHRGPLALAEAIDGLTSACDFPWNGEDLRRWFAALEPFDPGEALRLLYRRYADRHGKPRWGDKTPSHIEAMPELAAALPEARFVHIHRDGRDVAVSVRGMRWAPVGRAVEDVAAAWRDQVAAARHHGAALPGRFHEVRYEALLTDTEAILRELCAFLELRFAPAMLQAHARAADRHAELGTYVSPDRTVVVEGRDRGRIHEHTTRPPDPSRAGRWRDVLAADEVERFEAVAGDTLAGLGYPLASSSALSRFRS